MQASQVYFAQFLLLENSQNIEIEERSLKNIAQKVQLKLVAASDLAANHSVQVEFLLHWLAQRRNQATTAGMFNCLSILAYLATCERGRDMLNQGKSTAFLNEFFKSAEDDSLREATSQILKNLFGEQNLDGISNDQKPFQTIADVSAAKSLRFDEDDFQRSEFGNLIETNSKQVATRSHTKNNDFIVRTTETNKNQTSQLTQQSQTQQKSNQVGSIQTAHMEILHKNLTLKEPCELPFIHLSEQDEKRIFDVSVQLKFGDFRTVLQACLQFESILQDFPVEVLLQRTDIIKALLDLLEGGSANQSAFTNLASQQLINLCRRLRQLYRFNTNNTTKKSPGSSHNIHEYINLSYPPCKDGLWNTIEATVDLKTYGAQLPSEKLAAATLQGSLSCRAVLGLVLTKSIYLFKDTEKIGLYIQLMKEAWQSMKLIYRIEDNHEFTEIIHLILFAFDSVAEFYRDQLLDEVLIMPVLDEALVFVDALNRIVSECKDRFKQPFTETFFRNTEKLQMTMRRALFTVEQSDQNRKIILQFFQRIEQDSESVMKQSLTQSLNLQLSQTNLLQKKVTQSYNRANEALRRFQKVHNFKLTGSTNFEDVCFVESVPQFNAAIDILDELSGCIELKVEFPFEHLLLDCMVFAQLLQDQQQAGKIEEVERLAIMYLSLPIHEVRERILRRLYQRVRIVQAFQQQTKHKANNNYLLAKFTYRKRMLNQLINGMLINLELAQEQTKLQIDVGTVLIKILVVAYNEAGLIAQKHSNLNSFLLTFQALLPRYPDLIGLIDIIEENSQQNCRFLRTLRDLFNRQTHKREFSTSVLRGYLAKDANQSNDLLSTCVNLQDEQADTIAELDLVNLNYDFANFDIVNIQNILMSAKSDFNLKKSSLEQLSMLLFDTQRKGKTLFTVQGVTDMFNFAVQEVLTAYKTSKTYLGQQVQELPSDQLAYLDLCLKFIVLSQIFYSEEEVVKNLFNKIRDFVQQKVDEQLCDKFQQLISACLYFSGSQIRKNSIRVLYLMVFSPVMLKTKIQIIPQTKKKIVQVLTPDFCSKAFYMLVPVQEQVVKQPLRDDLLLSDEQKDFVRSMTVSYERSNQRQIILQAIGQTFVDQSLENYHNVMQSFEQLQNYVLALSTSDQNLISTNVLQKIQDIFRMLPTKDFEFNFLADFCMFSNQILVVADNLKVQKQVEALVQAFCQALRFHLLPYLYEASLSGIEQDIQNVHSSKLFFLNQFLDLLLKLSSIDVLLRQKYRTPSRFAENVLSTQLFDYIAQLYIILKDRTQHRHKVLMFINFVSSNYETRNLKLDQIPQLLINTIAQHRLSHSFEGNSMIVISMRTLINFYQKRLSHVALNTDQAGDLNQTVSLSSTANKVLQDFQSSGWITRFIESRDARLRCITWDLLTEMFDYNFFKSNQSLVHQAISSMMRDGELYCVRIAVLKFVNKLCDCLMHNTSHHTALNKDLDKIGSQNQETILSVSDLLDLINKQGMISKIHQILVQKDCPLIMLTQLLKLMSNMIQIDFKRQLPILTQLDYWTVLVEMISLENLESQDTRESRQAIKDVQSTLLLEANSNIEQVYLGLNAVIEFIFQAMKSDSQIANLLIKTTKLLPAVLAVAKQTLQNQVDDDINSSFQRQNSLQNSGLILIFIDKTIKILHLALLHPRDHTLMVLHDFLDKKVPLQSQDEQYGWIYIIKMLKIVGSRHSSYFYGHIDVKLAICRFIAEYLLRASQSNLKHQLDVTLHPFDATLHLNTDSIQHQDLTTYGGSLLLEFGKVFRSLYVDQRDSRQQISIPNIHQEHENSKIDICSSLAILCATSKAAKVQSIEQNLLKKVIDICLENVQALNLNELQRLTTKTKSSNSSKISNETSRKFKYAQMEDNESTEREIIRMFGLIKHIFYSSGMLLQTLVTDQNLRQDDTQKSFVSQNAMTKSTQIRVQKNKDVAIGERLSDLIGVTLDQITNVSVVENCLETAITIASQNKHFKNVFLTHCRSLAGLKRNTVVQLVVDQVLRQTLQGNTKRMQLLFQFLRSISLSAEIVKELSKQRLLEEIQSQLENVCKNEKDIKLLKSYLCQYTGFLAGFAYSDEGQRTVMKLKPVFTMSLFIIDTITPPQGPEISPLAQLVLNILLFLRNSSNNRIGKQHFISDPAFLPCLMAFLSSRQQHPRVRALTAACIWQTLFNHQGVKAALNSESIRSELQLLQGEYQRTTDISKYANFVSYHAERGQNPSAFDIVDHGGQDLMDDIRKVEQFTLIALNGIMTLLES